MDRREKAFLTKSKVGRKAYTKKSQYAVNIQLYRKGTEVTALGGMDKVRELLHAALDKALTK